MRFMSSFDVDGDGLHDGNDNADVVEYHDDEEMALNIFLHCITFAFIAIVDIIRTVIIRFI
jgi:endonuclease V-like protein UPF0215 family